MYMGLMTFDMFELQIGLPSTVLSYAQANTSHDTITWTRSVKANLSAYYGFNTSLFNDGTSTQTQKK